MNIAALFMLLLAGFGVSFVVLDVSRIAAPRRWPSARVVMADNFRPFAIFLALFAGPALFVQALWRIRASAGLSLIDTMLAAVIAGGWALCYGQVVMQCAGMLGLRVS
ncbi:hypothetical protein ADU59_08690 [Pararhizobium polonicum]|uniref:Transmembrane protein n=1 Tax=Pararhizobium polonicum TaxID=1612624 RepID=A0A1C7P5E2_9HYPH|nr:hypothetical protein [Pararhizobium polonicum]OBZ96397.1 hypothetical protein ADU59_08690 [Pararhizobium polonicum]